MIVVFDDVGAGERVGRDEVLGVGRLGCGSNGSDVSLTLINGLSNGHDPVLIHPPLSKATAPATATSVTPPHCMEEPDPSLTPHTNHSSRQHNRKGHKPSGNPGHSNLPRSDPNLSKNKPKSRNTSRLDAIGGRTTPRSASPDSKANDSSASQSQRKSGPKPKLSNTPGTNNSERSTVGTKPPSTKSDSRRRRTRENPNGGTTDASDSKLPREEGTGPHHGGPSVHSGPIHESADAEPSPLELVTTRRKRGGNFDRKLTAAGAGSRREERRANTDRGKYSIDPAADDLTSRLIHDLRTPPYLECIICYNPIRPLQPTWSCSPSSPIASTEGIQGVQYCWVTLHLKCVRSWASKSTTDTLQAYKARGENRPGDWLCIGCRAKRTIEPTSYRYVHHLSASFRTEPCSITRCFCGADVDPQPPKLATPHSCGNTCTRPRSCGHSCPMFCHPGPCPPCQVTRQVPCHCGSKVLPYKCSKMFSLDSSAAESISCGNICDKKLSCGKHSCTDVCHSESCKPCVVREVVKCYCGKAETDVSCGAGEPKSCSVEGETPWTGRFVCENTCER